jgi:uncharacterized protein (DUF1810 family)
MENTRQQDAPDLKRFVDAQATSYHVALSEIKNGRKRSHWMWYIFPQVAGLGQSEYSRFYGIRNRNEAEAYLQHPVLGLRLCEISNALLQLPGSDALSIFGSPDHKKLQSSMTLFASVPGSCYEIFKQVIDKFFEGKMDKKTIEVLENDLSAG